MSYRASPALVTQSHEEICGRQREWRAGRRRRCADGAELDLGTVRRPWGYGSLEREAGAAQKKGSRVAEALEAGLQVARDPRRCRC